VLRHGYLLSPTLYEIIKHWNEKYTTGINQTQNIILFADDQVIITNSENNLHALDQTVKTFGMKI
jgi:hypothetical protein